VSVDPADPISELPRPRPPRTLSERLGGLADTVGVEPWKLAAGGAALVAVFVAAMSLARPPSGRAGDVVLPRATPSVSVAVPTTGGGEVVVHVAGAVAKPGVYRLRAGARVSDAIDAAGGPAPDADLDRVNLAAPLADGTQVYVVRRGETGSGGAPGGGGGVAGGGVASGGAADSIVNINTATVDELDSLPGVGPATAQAIVDYRTEHGRFRSVEGLLEVRGIGESKLAALRKRVRV
jgi:competence protein ComEA